MIKIQNSRTSLRGEKIVPGIGIGKLFFIDKDFSLIPHSHLRGGLKARHEEVARFTETVLDAEKEIVEIMEREALPAEAQSILEVHRMMLVDPMLLEKITNEIVENGINSEWAVLNVFEEISQFLLKSGGDYYIRAKIADLEVIKDKLLSFLLGENGYSGYIKNLPEEDFVLCAHTLTISDLSSLAKNEFIRGIVLEIPGGVSHLSVVLRSLGIPSVLSVDNLLEQARYAQEIIVDAVNAEVIINPESIEKNIFYERKKSYDEYFSRFLEDVDKPAFSKDGYEVMVGANIESEDEIELVKKYGADFIGLFRTELMFLESEKIPTEEEHYSIYYEVLHRALPMSVTIRVFDFGGDKEGNIENTGSFGLRGIRFCFNYPEIFIPQLRALIRAASLGNLKILLPFISSVCEIRQFRAMLKEHATEMGLLENIEKIKVGAMIELPSALFIAEFLAREVDFFSVGTNDLIQYLMAVERKDKSLSQYFSHFHPAVIRSIYNLSQIARNHKIELSICGEMGGDPYFALLFMGMGIKSLSMASLSIPIIKKIVKSGYYSEGKELMHRVMMVTTQVELKEILKNVMNDKYPNIFKKVWFND